MVVTNAMIKSMGFVHFPAIGTESYKAMIAKIEKILKRSLTKAERKVIVKVSHVANISQSERHAKGKANYRGKIKPGTKYREIVKQVRFVRP